MFYLNSTLNFGIPSVLVFQLEVYYKLDRLLTGLTAQQKGATARLYSNKTSLTYFYSEGVLQIKIMFNFHYIHNFHNDEEKINLNRYIYLISKV